MGLKWIVGILLVLLFMCCYERYHIRKIRNRQGLKLQASFDSSCPALPYSTSAGLINDSVLLCRLFQELGVMEKLPGIHLEKFDIGVKSGDWLWVNMDYSDWKGLKEDTESRIILCKLKDTFIRATAYLPQHYIFYTGFTSWDFYEPAIPKDYSKFLHLCGKSPTKGTKNLVRTWLRHPEWPVLTIVCRDEALKIVQSCLRNSSVPSNLRILSEYVPQEQVLRLMNESGIHVCPSETEGFGHYANEAKAVKAVVLYTNGPALAELFDPAFAVPIQAVTREKRHGIDIPYSRCSPAAIYDAVSLVLALPDSKKQEMGKLARQDYLDQKLQFETRLRLLVPELLRMPAGSRKKGCSSSSNSSGNS